MNKTVTVSEISRLIKSAVENNPLLSSVYVRGEVSNITYHSTGHIYLTLKDNEAVLSCAFFRNSNKSLNFKIREGMNIIAFGSITVYEKRGSYQMIISSATPDGIGELQLKIEELKKKLSAEEIFNADRKRPLPFLPCRLGVVTSPTGAAFRDILKVALRRYPNIEILLAPAKVQGDDAAATIVKAIEELNRKEWKIDVIIAGRGGGSFEDLMPFNEESVVRAFFESRVPIISAVGHQIDHPLSDDAADAFAPTPSAAAEIALPVKSEIEEKISLLEKTGFSSLEKQIEEAKYRINNISSRRVFQNPLELVYMRDMELEDMKNKMLINLRSKIAVLKQQYNDIPDISKLFELQFKERKHRFVSAVQSLDQLSPLKVIARGYAAVFDENRNLIKTTDQTGINSRINVYLSDGMLKCNVLNAEKGVTFGKKTD
ncbi:MAG: exodeoxyribonuclease VII large subunit [Spirochaetes bacterium]|nr:exodeoxyribonuclease VII large subunit [Spirochaetota bacterium]